MLEINDFYQQRKSLFSCWMNNYWLWPVDVNPPTHVRIPVKHAKCWDTSQYCINASQHSRRLGQKCCDYKAWNIENLRLVSRQAPLWVFQKQPPQWRRVTLISGTPMARVWQWLCHTQSFITVSFCPANSTWISAFLSLFLASLICFQYTGDPATS